MTRSEPWFIARTESAWQSATSTFRHDGLPMAKPTPTLPPDVFEAVVRALADTLVDDYRSRWSSPATVDAPTGSHIAPPSPWLTLKEAAGVTRCGVKTLYSEVNAGRLRAVRVGGRRSVRFRREWRDE